MVPRILSHGNLFCFIALPDMFQHFSSFSELNEMIFFEWKAFREAEIVDCEYYLMYHEILLRTLIL